MKIEDFQTRKAVKETQQRYEEITGYNHKYEEAVKNKDIAYRLANKIYNMEIDTEITWVLNDGVSDISMGTKKVWFMDCDLIITVAYGGGMESILWLNEMLDVDDVYNYLKTAYKNYEIKG